MSDLLIPTLTELDNQNFNLIYKDGYVLEKGVVLTKKQLEDNDEECKNFLGWCTAYPDLFIDMIKPADSNFELYFYQRIFLRACLRYRYHYCTAPRAFSKSFISILAFYLKCMFQPGAKFFICAPGKEQSAKIAKEKIFEIWDLFPLLKKEIFGEGNFGNDYAQLIFRNGSRLDVVGALATTRGGRRQGGLIDEVRDHDGDILNEVVLPLMNVSRRTKAGIVNPNEPHQAQFYMTSAGVKTSFAYEKLIETFELSIIRPDQAFVWGCDYRLPVMHGLLDRQYVREIKMASTFKEESFAREYLGVWTGGSSDSWFDYDKLSAYRKLVNPETHEKVIKGAKHFYLLSVDVGRLNDQTVCCVFRVNPNNGSYHARLVNLFVLGRESKTKTFFQQAVDLKKIIASFNPREVVIDGNGLGIGLLDEMIKSQIDFETGLTYPPYGTINDDEYKKIQPRDAEQIVYVLKANGPLKSKIHGNCFSRLSSGLVHFLIKEQTAKNKLLSTKVGQKMKVEDRIKRLMPHEMTTKLFEEMANLRLKRTGTNLEIVLEPINTRYPDDKFTSFEYGLWRIKEIEEQYNKKIRKRGVGPRNLVFFSGGN